MRVHRETRRLVALCAAALAATSVLGAPGAVGSPGCPAAGVADLLPADALACLTAGQEVAPVGPAEFVRAPGVVYAGAYGPEPRSLPLPVGCDTPVAGSWTQDAGVVNRVTDRAGGPAFQATNTFHWLTGTGAGGRSTAVGDMWLEASGLVVYVSRELFEGRIGGRTGSATFYNLAHIHPSGSYVGRAFALGGTEGLAGLRLTGTYSGRLAQGGHWEQGARMCFVD